MLMNMPKILTHSRQIIPFTPNTGHTKPSNELQMLKNVGELGQNR